MNDPKSAQREKARKAGALALLGAAGACFVLLIMVIVLGVKLHLRSVRLAGAQAQLVQAKSDLAAAREDLGKARSQVADLQPQVDQAKSQIADLKTQLDQAKAASADLQGQLDKSKAQTADLQTQLGQSKAQSADLQAQLTQANAGSTQLLTQLDQARIQSMDLQTRLRKAESDLSQLQPMLLKERHMPVSTSLVKDRWGHGVTLHVNNLGQQAITVNISISSQGRVRTQSNVIGPAGTLNVDKLAAGDSVTITSDGYDPLNVEVQ